MDQVKKLFSSLSAPQLTAIVMCAIAVGGGVMWFSHWQRESGLRPLYTSLAAEDAAAMVQKLKEAGVDYRVADNGTTLLVPEDKVPELRLEMAGLGLPQKGRIGFEIFDKTNFGVTDFAEHVNYRRAVEGELERSIMALAEVQQARVHVTLPKESVFLETREAAKASILVGLRPGASLSSQNVAAIANLVSSAVEGLTPEAISIVDMRGNLLNRPRRDGLAEGAQLTEAALEYRQAIEHDLAVKINNTLEPLLGPDKFRTGVSAEVDMSSGEQSEESYDPTKSVMLTSQKTEDSSGVTHIAAGQPGTASNLPQPPPRPGGNTTGSVRRTENITYQSSRTVKHLKLPQGSLKRLSIAVLVDHEVKWQGQGNQQKRIVTPPPAEKLKTIQAVVATLVGLNPQRGDQLTIETLPFDLTTNAEPLPTGAAPVQKVPPATGFDALLKNKPVLYGAIAGVVLMIGVGVFAISRGKKKNAEVEMGEVLPPAPSAHATSLPSMTAGMGGMPSNVPALMPSRTEALLAQLQESGRNNPELWASVLRGWLAEEEAS
ncbi:MAG TPA: flagellar basal-body MS-ring/collar protein FliF [Bryobacteraceae bacterium]|jgi:flagellar M-ring protein FliF|nr:flagellar basal-body MS-ring/collar protein FliF [Bryobacteraceae bacterium]